MYVKFHTIKFMKIFAINFFDDFNDFLFKYVFRSYRIGYKVKSRVLIELALIQIRLKIQVRCKSL